MGLEQMYNVGRFGRWGVDWQRLGLARPAGRCEWQPVWSGRRGGWGIRFVLVRTTRPAKGMPRRPWRNPGRW